MHSPARLARYEAVGKALAAVEEGGLADLVARAVPLGTGIGGTVATLDIGGARVFVKKVPLTDLERRPENLRSTANLFALPVHFQYGVGSAGFGVWRELAVHITTTSWVLAGKSRNFPMLYHWRVLPRSSPGSPTCDPSTELERQVANWGGSPAIRERLTALRSASAEIVLFLEHFPRTLRSWLDDQRSVEEPALRAALEMVERDLRAVTSFMNSRGILHFDAHFDNILTDGHHLYFGDFGLAVSNAFDLSTAETSFIGRHADFDRAYVMTRLVNYLVDATCGVARRHAVIHDHSGGTLASPLPPPAKALVTRFASIAMLMNAFYATLLAESRDARYPSAGIAQACREAGLTPD